MAKGDKKKVQNVVNAQIPQAQNATSNAIADTSGRTSSFQNLYGPAAGQNVQDYSSTMGRYGDLADRTPKSGNYLTNFLEKPSAGTLPGIGPLNLPAGLQSGYSNFANTGGFSGGDLQNIRARAIAPIRGIQDAAMRGINRQAAMRGTAYSPNTAAALAKSVRDSAYAAGDTATNAEAGIANMVQQGKLAGLSGLGNIGQMNLGARGQDITGRGQDLSARGLDLNAILGAGNQENEALRGMTGLYSASPGLTSTFGQQVLGSSGQNLQANQMQQAIAEMAMRGQLGVAGTPSTFQNVLGNIGSVAGTTGKIAGMF